MQVTYEQAKAKGFTRRVLASNGCYELELLVMPGCDLDDTVRVYDVDEGEWLDVNGWLFTFDDCGE